MLLWMDTSRQTETKRNHQGPGTIANKSYSHQTLRGQIYFTISVAHASWLKHPAPLRFGPTCESDTSFFHSAVISQRRIPTHLGHMQQAPFLSILKRICLKRILEVTSWLDEMSDTHTLLLSIAGGFGKAIWQRRCSSPSVPRSPGSWTTVVTVVTHAHGRNAECKGRANSARGGCIQIPRAKPHTQGAIATRTLRMHPVLISPSRQRWGLHRAFGVRFARTLVRKCLVSLNRTAVYSPQIPFG